MTKQLRRINVKKMTVAAIIMVFVVFTGCVYRWTVISSNPEESKKSGRFVKLASFEPKEVTVNGVTIRIKEAWVEYDRSENGIFNTDVVLSAEKERGYQLVIILANYRWAIEDVGLFFRRRGTGHAFGLHSGPRGDYLYCAEYDDTEIKEMTVDLVKDWKSKPLKTFKFYL